MLTYCRKWWRDTVSVKKLGSKETITFYTRGNKVAHVSTKDVFECVAASTEKPNQLSSKKEDWCFERAGDSEAKCAPLVKAKRCVFKNDKCILLERKRNAPCCKALTATCLACAKGMTPFEYCKRLPQTTGCKKDDGKYSKPASWVQQCRSQALKKIYPSSISSEFRLKRGDGTPMMCTLELARTVVKTAIVESVGSTLLRDATVDVACGGSSEKSDRRLNKEGDGEAKSVHTSFVFTIFGSKKIVQDVVVSTGALDEDDVGLSFASKVAAELQEQDGDGFENLKVESIGKVEITESEPTIFVFDEPEKEETTARDDKKDAESAVVEEPETAEQVESSGSDDPGIKREDQEGDADTDNDADTDTDADLSSMLNEDRHHEDRHDSKKGEHFPWYFVVGGICGMAALALVLMYIGYSLATKRKRRRDSIRMGSVILEADSVMPVSVVLPQQMGKVVAERRPTWSTTLEGGRGEHAFTTVVQHE
jgi:hypothetical protein